MASRDPRRVRVFRRRLLTAVLVLGIGAAVVLMAAGSGLSVAGATADHQAAAAVASRWLGIPVGVVIWFGIGALAFLAGLFSSIRSRAVTPGSIHRMDIIEPAASARSRLVANAAELSVAS